MVELAHEAIGKKKDYDILVRAEQVCSFIIFFYYFLSTSLFLCFYNFKGKLDKIKKQEAEMGQTEIKLGKQSTITYY